MSKESQVLHSSPADNKFVTARFTTRSKCYHESNGMTESNLNYIPQYYFIHFFLAKYNSFMLSVSYATLYRIVFTTTMQQPTDDLTLPDFTDAPWQLLLEDTEHLDFDRNNAVVVESSLSLGYSGTVQLPWMMPSVDNLQVISDPFMNTFLSYPNLTNPLPFWTRSEMGGEFNISTALQPFDQHQVVTSWPSTVGTTIPSSENVWLPFSSNNQGDLTMPTLPWSAPEKDGHHHSRKLVHQWDQLSPPDKFISVERSKGRPWESINADFAQRWGRVGDKALSMRLSRLKKQNSFVRELLLHDRSDLSITFYCDDASRETLGDSHK